MHRAEADKGLGSDVLVYKENTAGHVEPQIGQVQHHLELQCESCIEAGQLNSDKGGNAPDPDGGAGSDKHTRQGR